MHQGRQGTNTESCCLGDFGSNKEQNSKHCSCWPVDIEMELKATCTLVLRTCYAPTICGRQHVLPPDNDVVPDRRRLLSFNDRSRIARQSRLIPLQTYCMFNDQSAGSDTIIKAGEKATASQHGHVTQSTFILLISRTLPTVQISNTLCGLLLVLSPC